MRGGFMPLVNPASLVSEVDRDATRVEREQLREAVALRVHLAWLLASTSPGDDLVRVTPYRLVEGEADTIDDVAS